MILQLTLDNECGINPTTTTPPEPHGATPVGQGVPVQPLHEPLASPHLCVACAHTCDTLTPREQWPWCAQAPPGIVCEWWLFSPKALLGSSSFAQLRKPSHRLIQHQQNASVSLTRLRYTPIPFHSISSASFNWLLLDLSNNLLLHS